jgi:hypothetical protein
MGSFTPLENPSIYARDGKNRKHQLLIEGGVKALPFLTGFTGICKNVAPFSILRWKSTLRLLSINNRMLLRVDPEQRFFTPPSRVELAAAEWVNS